MPDGIREVRVLEVLVRVPQGRGSAGSQKQTVISGNGDDDLRHKNGVCSDEGRETSKTFPAVFNSPQVEENKVEYQEGWLTR